MASRALSRAATPSIASSIGEAVVVGAADDVDEDERVEGDEGGGAQRVDAARGGEAGDERGDGRGPRARRPP